MTEEEIQSFKPDNICWKIVESEVESVCILPEGHAGICGDPDHADRMIYLMKRYRDALDDICELCQGCRDDGCGCKIALNALEG